MGLCCWSSSSSDIPPSSSNNNSSQIPASGFNSNSTTTNVSSTTATTGSQWSEAASDRSDGTSLNGRVSARPNLKVFSFVDLKTASRNFSTDTFLGEGGFGKVYKGWVDGKTLLPSKTGSGMLIAIKKLNPGSTQGFDEWQSEVNFLGRLSHPNLVRLLGYCWEDKELLLVYEFMPRGSLENHLFRRKLGNTTVEPLSWELRLKIATGAARGLSFLHSPKVQVIYRDFKAANILLDSNYNAKMSDFGLARLGPGDGRSHVTTRIMGTSGYAAPEYMATGHLYVKSDVYGFGVVLLEILTGLRALDTSRPKEQHKLVEWLRPSLSSRRKVRGLMDQRIVGQYSSKAALQVAEITMKCLELDPKRRPSMKEVVEVLEQVQAMERQRHVASEPTSYSAPCRNDGHAPSRPHSPFRRANGSFPAS